MIKWLTTNSNLPGFTYYPLLEIIFGIFLMIAAITVPVLFLVYNGIKAEQWAELLFCGGFLVLFIYMGKSLTFQSLQARKTTEGFEFYQNMRDPAVNISLKNKEWLGIKTEEENFDDETILHLNLKTVNGNMELYKGINRKEIAKIVEALTALRKKAEEEHE